MSKEFKRYTITAALPYANGSKHIGHLAGAYLPADIYARYLRKNNKDVAFICGSDEHGAAITLQAIEEKTTPKEIVDKYHTLLIRCFRELGISFDIYHRTTEPLHHETAQGFFLHLYNKGELVEESSLQFYDEEASIFLADRYIIGTCPTCANEKAYGDQCEKCGRTLSPDELINPVSKLSGKTPVKKETTLWYLPLDLYEPWLKEWILNEHKDWKVNVYGQCKSWLDAGLNKRAVTRDLNWGVKVPLPNAEGKVLYVWFDAPIGYISATKQWALDNNKNWEDYWKKEDTRLIHFIGKDNIVFHCIIFPAMLKAHGDYILPDNVPSNEFMNLEGDKMSTSRHWSVEMHDYISQFPYKSDQLRYCLISNMPETKDSEFTWKDFQTKNNSELVAILGNLVNRVMVLVHKYYGGIVPDVNGCEDLEKVIHEAKEKVSNSLEQFRYREALNEMMNIARHGNKLLTDKEPWKLIKTDPEATKAVLFDCVQLIANLAIICEPFMPFTSKKLWEQLGMQDVNYSWEDIGRQDLIAKNHEVAPAVILFEKIEDEIIDIQIKKLQDSKKTIETPIHNEMETLKETITYEDFDKMDIRSGIIIEAKKVEKADKLLELKVDIGLETRTVISGIAMYFKPEDIIGQQVSVLCNLAPRKLRGIESKGMILMASDKEGKLYFVNAPNQVPAGSIIK
ncbi:MAG: methionine--tRNA ligase [Bacteroidota bacterium]